MQITQQSQEGLIKEEEAESDENEPNRRSPTAMVVEM
jgi:hypothetical protein